MFKEDKQINLYFVSKLNYENATASKLMKETYQNAVDWNLKPQWIDEVKCATVDQNIKGNVFVFEKFDGECFRNLLTTHRHSRIVGPSCLLKCFKEQVAIPHTPYPILNMAMNGVIITASVKPSELKNDIKTLVGYMGGNYLDLLTTSTTHLVVSGVLSEKYLKANEVGIPVLRYEWVKEVWKRSLEYDVKATEENILNEFKCPMFHKLIVTASGLDDDEKQKIRKIITDGGGTYSGDLDKRVTNILILPSGQGRKYKYAKHWKIPCLHPTWLNRCMKEGYAVRHKDFLVGSENNCSTPVQAKLGTKIHTLIDSNDSEISIIPSAATHKSIVEETANFDSQSIGEPLGRRNTPSVFKTPVKSIPKTNLSDARSYQKNLENITVNDAKIYPHLLDGCKVYLSGFNSNEEEKLKRVLKYSGAIRYTELNDSVTHVLVGHPTTSEIGAIRNNANKPHIIKLDWLCNSIKNGCLEKENNYAFLGQNKESNDPSTSSRVEPPSPLSKRGLQILNPTREIPMSTRPIVGVDQILIEKYSQTPDPDVDVPPNRVTASGSQMIEPIPVVDSMEDSNIKIFDGLTFMLSAGYGENQAEGLKSTIVQYGGQITTNFHSYYDYILAPFIQRIQGSDRNPTVTSIWLDQCLDEKKLVDVKYYHKPITPLNSNFSPLENCVITFSSYNEFEKQYLKNLTYSLGAKSQDVLAKKDNIEKDIRKTTHLVSSQMQGNKYEAAKKWNLPVIGHTWLIECYKQGIKLPVDNYLLEKESNSSIPSTSKTIPSRPESAIKSTNKSSVTDDVPDAPSLSRLTLTSKSTVDQVEEYSKSVTASKNVNHVEAVSSRIGKPSEPSTSSKSSNNKPFTTPSVTEAIQRAPNRNATSRKRDVKEASSSNEWPTGFILKINECPSSSLKRKFDGQVPNTDRISQTNGPRRKMLKHHDNLASPYEVVGWQDTLTDISNNQLDNIEVADENGRGGKEPVGCNQRRITEEIIEPPIGKNYLISISNNERKIYFDNIIKLLGGIVLPSFPVDCIDADRASHMIIDVLKKTEKLLCSIASGLWVLHPSYLEECKDKKKFVEEEQFEWGNPLNERLLTGTSKDHKLIAAAAHRWRKTIETGGPTKRPFVGMKAVIISAPNDEAVNALTRVVKSGGGITLQSCEILSCTHCIVNKAANLELIPVSLKCLAERRIHCVPSVYLSDHLMNDPPPDIRSCYFDTYKRLFKL